MLPSNPLPTGAYDMRLGYTPHPYYGSVDVEVTFASTGTTYRATFYTFARVLGLMEEYRTTGQNCNGLYFAPPSWILLKDLSEATIRLTIEELIEHRFQQVFKAVE